MTRFVAHPGGHRVRRALERRVEGALLRVNRRVWRRLPAQMRDERVGRAYGRWLHVLSSRNADREMFLGTLFLRNRPALELMRRLIAARPQGATVKIAVLGCSVGVEVYSILWTLRRARPDLELVTVAVDISTDALAIAEAGLYGPQISEAVHQSIFQALSDAEKREMFDWNGDQASVRSWLREGIDWRVGDASDPGLVEELGPQDIVVANNFLCHMEPPAAERCLRNFARLAEPDGYLFVSGVDLDVRTAVAVDLGWEPVTELMTEVHEGDPLVRADWPWEWWGLEPLDRARRDWQTRYASVFHVARPA